MERDDIRIARLEERVTAAAKLTRQAREADQMAVKTALDSQRELAEKHNDLIRQMQDRDSTYLNQAVYEERHNRLVATVEAIGTFQARLAGGLIVMSFIGIANLIKLWFG